MALEPAPAADQMTIPMELDADAQSVVDAIQEQTPPAEETPPAEAQEETPPAEGETPPVESETPPEGEGETPPNDDGSTSANEPKPDVEAEAARLQNEQAQQQQQEIGRLLSTDPDFALSYYRALDREGRLPPHMKVLLDRVPVAGAKVVEEPKGPTEEEIGQKFTQLIAEGRMAEAFKLAGQVASAPLQAEVNKLKKTFEDGSASARTSQIAAAQAAIITKVEGELLGVAKKYPAIVGVRQNGKPYFKDMDIYKSVRALSSGVSPDASTADIVELALLKRGQLGKSKPPAPPTKPGITSAPRAAAPKPKVPKGMMVMEMSAE